jgi:hypothetical protein
MQLDVCRQMRAQIGDALLDQPALVGIERRTSDALRRAA